MECKTSHLPLIDQLKAMLRKDGVLVGLPLVEVAEGTHQSNALSCGLNHLNSEQMMKNCIGSDSCGKPAIRVKYIDSCDTLSSCANRGDDDKLRQMFAYDESAKTFALVFNVST